MARTPTKNSKAGEAAIAAGDTAGQPVPAPSAAPAPLEVDTSDLSRREKLAARALVDESTPRLYTVTVTDRVKPERRDVVTLVAPDGYPLIYRRGLVAADATDEQKAAAKKSRILTREVMLTSSQARQLVAEWWLVSLKADDAKAKE